MPQHGWRKAQGSRNKERTCSRQTQTSIVAESRDVIPDIFSDPQDIIHLKTLDMSDRSTLAPDCRKLLWTPTVHILPILS